jgi:outer membrane protein
MMNYQSFSLPLCITLVVLVFASMSASAESEVVAKKTGLPDAPKVNLLAQVAAADAYGTLPVASVQTNATGSDAPDHEHPKLTRTEAEQMAVRNNPQVSVSRLLALAQHQIVRENRASLLPNANAAITAVEAEDGSRISAGSLLASALFEHAGAGGGFTQLITDFGKSSNLIASAKLQEKAQNANAIATQNDVVLATDQAFYDALQAQELLKVAKQNVTTRQTLQSQVNQMTANKLKSMLDLSFANVSLSQAKLLYLDAQNNADSSMAALDAVVGLDRQITYELVDDSPTAQQPPPDVNKLIQQGLQQRPDLQATNYSKEAAIKFSRATRDQMLPSISAAGTAGITPIRPDQYYVTNWWGGIGVNMNIPIFNGFLYSAQAKEASIRAEITAEQGRDLRDRIVRDIRTAWLTANTSYQRVAVTGELLKQANLSLSLAQTRYQMGLSSIVELSQAEYQQTDAAISNTNAQYQYRMALAALNYQIGSTP